MQNAECKIIGRKRNCDLKLRNCVGNYNAVANNKLKQKNEFDGGSTSLV